MLGGIVICCAICRNGRKPCGRVFATLADWVEHYRNAHARGRHLPDFLQKVLDTAREGM